jgi:hypothetical protein
MFFIPAIPRNGCELGISFSFSNGITTSGEWNEHNTNIANCFYKVLLWNNKFCWLRWHLLAFEILMLWIDSLSWTTPPTLKLVGVYLVIGIDICCACSSWGDFSLMALGPTLRVRTTWWWLWAQYWWNVLEVRKCNLIC